MLFPANFNFKAPVIDVVKLVDRHGVHPVELTGVAPPPPNRVFSTGCQTN
jgi:hypothetical protein